MAKMNNIKNPLKNKRNFRRKRALERAKNQLKSHGYKDPLLGFIKNTDKRDNQLAEEIVSLTSKIVH